MKKIGGNAMRRAIDSQTENIDKMGESGIYNANPSPSLRKYPASTNSDDIPMKFAESDISTKLNNIVRGSYEPSERNNIAPIPQTSTMIRTPNRYRNQGKVEQLRNTMNENKGKM